MSTISAAAAAEANKTLNESTIVLDVFEALKALMTVDARDETVTSLVAVIVDANIRKANGTSNVNHNPHNAISSRPEWENFLDKKLDQLSMTPKLDTENWHMWRANFQSILSSNSLVASHLFGESEPQPYLPELDAELACIIRVMCVLSGPKSVFHILDKEEGMKGRALFKHLQASLTKHDGVLIGQLDMALMHIRMTGNNVSKLIHDVRTLSHKASLLGAPFTERQKLYALRHCTEYTEAYGQTWRMLRVLDKDTDFDHVCLLLGQRAYHLDNAPSNW